MTLKLNRPGLYPRVLASSDCENKCENKNESKNSIHTIEKIDNIKCSVNWRWPGKEGNDGYKSLQFILHYDLFAPEPKNDDSFDDIYYADVNFSKLENEDEDSDLVLDIDDYCPKTPIGVKVDINGCPLDDDNDGWKDNIEIDCESDPLDKLNTPLDSVTSICNNQIVNNIFNPINDYDETTIIAGSGSIILLGLFSSAESIRWLSLIHI